MVIMGVCGAGKTEIGRRLATALGSTFLDADDFHPPENVAKMRAGTPLVDADRWPWLDKDSPVNGTSATISRLPDRS